MSHKIKWLGHATFEITTSEGVTMVVDPWYDDNPSNPEKVQEVEKADVVLITHDHFDHLADAAALLKKTGATVVGQPEIGGKMKEDGVAEDQVVNGLGMNVGGSVEVKGVKITMVQAFHSSMSGDPAGFILTLEDGKTVYHAGDTGVFSSMELFQKLYGIDLALLPIGSVFTMDSEQAACAVELLKPKKVVPMHYGTFPILEQTPDRFEKLARERLPSVEVVKLAPGDTCEL